MLAVQQLEAGYGESVILRDVSLKVKQGQVVCLLGRNGVGKTTLMKSIMGLLKAREGSVSYNGSDLTKKAPGLRAKSGIGYVPQGREIFAQLSVYENLLLGLEASRVKVICCSGRGDCEISCAADHVYAPRRRSERRTAAAACIRQGACLEAGGAAAR